MVGKVFWKNIPSPPQTEWSQYASAYLNQSREWIRIWTSTSLSVIKLYTKNTLHCRCINDQTRLNECHIPISVTQRVKWMFTAIHPRWNSCNLKSRKHRSSQTVQRIVNVSYHHKACMMLSIINIRTIQVFEFSPINESLRTWQLHWQTAIINWSHNPENRPFVCHSLTNSSLCNFEGSLRLTPKT